MLQLNSKEGLQQPDFVRKLRVLLGEGQMFRLSAIAMLAASLAVAACQPSKSPEELAAERNAAALKEVVSALGGQTTLDGQTMNPEQMAAAMAQAGAMAAAMDPNMSAEDRAKMQAITGAIASGQVHPAASAYVAGLDRVFAVISTVKDDATANAAKPQLAAIYAEMSSAFPLLIGRNKQSRSEVS